MSLHHPQKTSPAMLFSVSSYKRFLSCLLSSLLLSLPSHSQSAEKKSSKKSVQVQVVVIGQSVPPRYEIVKSVRMKELKGSGSDGGNDAETIPAPDMKNVPLQIAPEADELPPSPLYVKTGKTWTMIPVRENSPSPKVSVPLGGNVVVATGKESTDSGGKRSVKYNSIAEFPIAEGQDNMLILIVKDPRQPLKWKIKRKLAINTSWSLMPAGSFTIYNASFLPLRGKVSSDTIASLSAFKKMAFKPKSDASGQVPYYFEVQHADGSWHTVVNSSTSLGTGGRLIAIPYGVVLPQTKRYASLMIIRDFADQGAIETPKSENDSEKKP